MEADLLTSLCRDLVVEAETLPVDPLHVRCGVVGGDEAGCVPGRAGGQLQLLQQEDVPTSPGQVVGRGHAHYPAPYDHRVGLVTSTS